MKDDDFDPCFFCYITDELTDGRTFVIVGSLSRLKKASNDKNLEDTQ